MAGGSELFELVRALLEKEEGGREAERERERGSGRAAVEGRGGTSATRDTRNAGVVRRCRGQFGLGDPGKISGRYITIP